MTSRRLLLGLIAVAILFSAGDAPAQFGSARKVTVLDSSGKPAAGVSVHILRACNLGLEHGDYSLVRQRLETNSNGVAIPKPDPRNPMPAYYAFSDTEAALYAAGPVVSGGRNLTLRLGKAILIRAKLVDPEGKAVSDARVRAIVAGGGSMCGIDGRVEKDGTLRFPPIPARGMDVRGAMVEVYARGFVPVEVPLESFAGDSPVTIRVGRPRSVAGQVVTPEGKPVAGAKVIAIARAAFDDYARFRRNEPRTDAAGRFELEGLVPDALIVYVIPRSHTPWSTEVPAGTTAVNLGRIVVDRGLPITGRVREEDRAPILNGFVNLSDARGMILREADLDATGRFTLKRLAPGAYHLVAGVHFSKNIAGTRSHRLEVSPGLEALKIVIPRGLSISLVDAEGRAVAVRRVNYRIEGHPRRPEGWGDQLDGLRGAFHELRLRVPGPATVKVILKIRGYEDLVVPARVDASGSGCAKAVLVRGSGGGLEPPWRRLPRLPTPPPARPKSSALIKIALPENPTKAQVREYVQAILDTTRGRRRFSGRDPEVEMLIAVGPGHVDVLLEAIAARGRTDSSYLRWALRKLVRSEHRDMIVSSLAESPELSEIIVAMGWEKAASKTLKSVLARRPLSLPTHWIRAVAALKDRSTYRSLRAYLIHGLNRRQTYLAIRRLPGFDINEAARAMWSERSDPGSGDFGRLDAAIVAAECGIVDALGVLIDELTADQRSTFRPHDLERVVARLTKQSMPPREIRGWFEKFRTRLGFDRKAGVYRVE